MFGRASIVSFLVTALAGSAIAAPAPSTPEEGNNLAKRGVETIFLSNCVKGGSGGYNLSGMFYYADGDQTYNGQKPASGNYASVNGGSLVGWEGKSVSGTFGSGVTFTSSISGGSHATYVFSGTGTNGYRNFNCYRDNERQLFSGSTNWGACYSVYYCN